MRFTSITCPKCGFEQSVSVPEQGTKALFKCDNCREVVGTPNGSVYECVICAYGNDECPNRALGHANHQKIRWNKVTWYSKVIAVILFVLVYIVGFWLGTEYQSAATDIVSLQNESQKIAVNLAHNKSSRVLGVTTEDLGYAIYWIDTNQQNPFIDECKGAPTAKYSNSKPSLNDLLNLQLIDARSIDRLTGYTNPLAKTSMVLDEISNSENETTIKISGDIESLSFCEQIQVISQLQAVIRQAVTNKDVKVVLNNADLFIVPAL